MLFNYMYIQLQVIQIYLEETDNIIIIIVIGFNDFLTTEKDKKFDKVGFQAILSYFGSY